MLNNGLILIIEDEEDIADLLAYHLEKAGFDTECFLSTVSVKKFLEEEDVALMIVDRNLPDIDGAEFVKMLKQQGYDIPTIFLSAKDTKKDILDGFDKGGDDYITKPFEINETMARIKALIKRTRPQTGGIVAFKDIKLNINSQECFISSKLAELTKLEFDLLHELIKYKGSVLERDYLLESVWKKSLEEVNLKTVNVAIKRLKEKIDPTG
ncbi:MAG: response regulator transcription factor, partial [Epsilonproteobacteria bacterium]|nr:response regulator transcription factor [Campylobacterota bacterium]